VPPTSTADASSSATPASATPALAAARSAAPGAGRAAQSAGLGVGLAFAVTGSILFSAKAIFVKLSYRYGVDAVTLVALRMAFAAPLFAVAGWVSSRGAPRLQRSDRWRVVAIGTLGYYAASFLDFVGLQYVTAGLERLILYLSPTVVLLMSALFLRRPILRADVLALALAYAGIAVAFAHDVSFVGEGVAFGALCVFGAAVSYAAYLVLSGEVVARIGALRLTSYAMAVATVLCLAQFVALRPFTALLQPGPVYVLSVATAVLSTVLPVFATMLAVERIGAPRVALASIVGPVSTILLAWAVLDEVVTGWQLGGAVLVVAGVFTLSRAESRNRTC
jgi:drug/metabolite transporter (DMT)-like permease